MSGLGSMFAGPKMPAAQPTVRMPDQDDPEYRRKRREKIEEQRRTGGRDATNLSYSNDVLGS